jgi:hypothetical protein
MKDFSNIHRAQIATGINASLNCHKHTQTRSWISGTDTVLPSSTPDFRLTQLASYPWNMGGVLSGVKLAKRKAEYSSPSNTGVKNVWEYFPVPSQIYMVSER